MLSFKEVDLLETDPVPIRKNSIVDEIYNSKVIKTKNCITMTISKRNNKSKNLVKPFFAKSQLFAWIFRSSFFTPEARLASTKLR